MAVGGWWTSSQPWPWHNSAMNVCTCATSPDVNLHFMYVHGTTNTYKIYIDKPTAHSWCTSFSPSFYVSLILSVSVCVCVSHRSHCPTPSIGDLIELDVESGCAYWTTERQNCRNVQFPTIIWHSSWKYTMVLKIVVWVFVYVKVTQSAHVIPRNQH